MNHQALVKKRSIGMTIWAALAVVPLVAGSCSSSQPNAGSVVEAPTIRAGVTLDGAPLVEVDPDVRRPTFELDLSGLALSDVELADDEPAGEDPALPPAVAEADADEGRDNGGALDEATDNLDDLIDIPIALDPGSALACAAFELGRDAAIDGDAVFGVALAERVTTNGQTIEDSTILDIARSLAAAAAVEMEAAQRGLDRCRDLGYETAS